MARGENTKQNKKTELHFGGMHMCVVQPVRPFLLPIGAPDLVDYIDLGVVCVCVRVSFSSSCAALSMRFIINLIFSLKRIPVQTQSTSVRRIQRFDSPGAKL